MQVIHDVQSNGSGKSSDNPYFLETASRACEVLKCFENNPANLKLTDVIQRTGLNRTIVSRIVHTLTESGWLKRHPDRSYSSQFSFGGNPRFRIGYAAQANEDSFSAAVTAGIRLAAVRQNVELVALDNCYSATGALKDARRLAPSGVTLVLDFQMYAKMAPAVSAIFREAEIPH